MFLSQVNYMNAEVVRLAVIVVVALGVLYLFQQWQEGNLNIKNEGMLSVEPQVDSAPAQVQSQGEHDMTSVHQPKHTEHGQIDSLGQDEQYMMNVKKDQLHKNNTNVLPHPQISNNSSPQGNFQPAQLSNFSQMDCFPKDQLSAKDLIPREDAYNVWNQSNPPVQGTLSNKNYVDSGHHFGLNTVGQSLKNPNLQLRSDPLIPQRQVGPWHQSTVEADTNRRPLEIGGV